MSESSHPSATTAAPSGADVRAGGEIPLPSTGKSIPAAWRSGMLLLFTALVCLVYWFNPPLNVQPRAGVIMDLPVFVGDYFGKKGEITKVELAILPKDTELVRRYYADNAGHQISCSIVLSGSEQRSIHRPEGCLEGQGWTITGQRYLPITLLSGHKLTARELTLQQRVTAPNGDIVTIRAFYVYWFVGDKVTTPSEIKRVLLSNWDRVIHNRAHRWAYVSFFSMITDNLQPNGLNPQQTEDLLVDFTKQIVPKFQVDEMGPASGQESPTASR
jgi:hypothetical protein